MDKKAKEILINTYWSKNGWKSWKDRNISSEDFAYAKEKGLMFDPITISYDECVRRIIKLSNTITMEKTSKAFLCSLTTRRLDWRSAIASYSIAKLIAEYAPTESNCPYEGNLLKQIVNTHGVRCNLKYGLRGKECYKNEDLNVLNFERIKWGGVRQGDLLYTLFDLEQFIKEEIPEPTSDDIKIFEEILKAVNCCNPNDYPSALRDRIAKISLLKSNKDERDVIIEILSCIGVLTPKSCNRPETAKHDWIFATYWRGEDSYDRALVNEYFGKYL